MIKFKDEETRTFFHLLNVELQMQIIKIYEDLEARGLGLYIEEASLDEDSKLVLVLRITG